MGDEISVSRSAPQVSIPPVEAGMAAGKRPAAVQQAGQPQPPAPKVEPPRINPVTVDAEKMMAKMQEAVTQLNKMAVNSGRGLNFQADPKLGRHVITVTNTETGEVVRTIPTEVAIRVAHGIEDFKGLLHDDAA
jgi:flagellar protein FlaG